MSPPALSGPESEPDEGPGNTSFVLVPRQTSSRMAIDQPVEDESDDDDMVQLSSDEEIPASATNVKRKKRRRRKKKRNLLRDITPLNMKEAREAFLADPSVNPLFLYSDSKRCNKACRKSEVCSVLLEEAITVLERVLDKFGCEETLLSKTEGSMIETEEQVCVSVCFCLSASVYLHLSVSVYLHLSVSVCICIYLCLCKGMVELFALSHCHSRCPFAHYLSLSLLSLTHISMSLHLRVHLCLCLTCRHAHCAGLSAVLTSAAGSGDNKRLADEA